MAAEDIVINNIARTSIQIDELAVPNRTGGDNAGLDDALMDADDKSFGGYKPVVFINGYYVEKYLDYFSFCQNLDLLQIFLQKETLKS